jgi:hypothetical protein
MAEGTTRCAECVRRGRACDGFLVGDSMGRVAAAIENVEVQEDRAEEDLLVVQAKVLQAQREVTEVLARLRRLRKQKQTLRSRHNELFSRGMQELDEQDALERELTGLEELTGPELLSLESEAVANARTVGAVDIVDWSSLGLVDSFLPSLVDLPRNPEVVAGSPPGAT